MEFKPDPKCPVCGSNMTYGASHTGSGCQAECTNSACGHIEQVHDKNDGE